MTLEEYKKKVEEHLVKKCNFTTQSAKKLIALYEEDFPQFLKDNWSPLTAASAMIAGY